MSNNNNSCLIDEIKQEIQRFENVHPLIYSQYDLVDSIKDPILQSQIYDNLTKIESSFVDSQEWTLSKEVKTLRIAILGTENSGKGQFVYKYLTGTLTDDESPEGGRYKKEIIIKDNVYLLLIRDHAGPPDLQLSRWLDAAIFVFNAASQTSFSAVFDYYHKFSHFLNLQTTTSSAFISLPPISVVNILDYVDQHSPRVVDEAIALKSCQSVCNCHYSEASVLNDHSISLIFNAICCRVVDQGGHVKTPAAMIPDSHQPPFSFNFASHQSKFENGKNVLENDCNVPVNTSSSSTATARAFFSSSALLLNSGEDKKVNKLHALPSKNKNVSMLLTSTGSSLFPSSIQNNFCKSFAPGANFSQKKFDSKQEYGIGRAIPIKQGWLQKKSQKSALNKDWKKKYVVLKPNAVLAYFNSLQEYMSNENGKQIPLYNTTVKIPGLYPGQQTMESTSNSLSSTHSSTNCHQDAKVSSASAINPTILPNSNHSATTNNLIKRVNNILITSTCNVSTLNSNETQNKVNPIITSTPQTKKKFNKRRSNKFSISMSSSNESAGKALSSNLIDNNHTFIIVSLDSRTWYFDAISTLERNSWVDAIEEQILSALQKEDASNAFTKMSSLHSMSEMSSVLSQTTASCLNNSQVPSADPHALMTSDAKIPRNIKPSSSRQNLDAETVNIIKNIPGNAFCVDCEAPNPEWASLNLGALLCIECSGIHRNLGTHISRVRSLFLDAWNIEHVHVMMTLGNALCNTIYERTLKGKSKPSPATRRAIKEKWIRDKYEKKEFLPIVTANNLPLGEQLINAVTIQDIPNVLHILTQSSPRDVNFRNKFGTTAYHIVTKSCNIALTQILIWHQADTFITDANGLTALQFALKAASNPSITPDANFVQFIDFLQRIHNA